MQCTGLKSQRAGGKSCGLSEKPSPSSASVPGGGAVPLVLEADFEKQSIKSVNVPASSVVNVKSNIIPEGGVGAVVILEADLSVNVNATSNAKVIKNTNVESNVNVKSDAYYFMSWNATLSFDSNEMEPFVHIHFLEWDIPCQQGRWYL